MERARIVRLLQELPPEQRAALVTVVRTEGSTYRRPGAMAVVTTGGVRAGLLSGGCLEPDLERIAQEAAESGTARVQLYELSGDGEALLGWNLGCGGTLEVLFQPLEAAGAVAKALSAAEAGRASWMVVRLDGDDPASVGRTLVLPDSDASPDGSLGDPDLDAWVAERVHGWESSAVRQEASPSGSVRLFPVQLEPAPLLLLCGGGEDALVLADAARALGWRVTLTDHREWALRADRLSSGVHALPAAEFDAHLEQVAGPGVCAVVMSHNLERDAAYLRALLDTDVAYLGLLGPRRRLERLLAVSDEVDAEPLATLRTPAGLDLGAESPEEIALSILAEMLATLRGRSGGPLRDLDGPIHGG